MVIRKGRSETADKLFTYVALVVIGGIIIGAIWFGWKTLGQTVGLTTEESLLDTEVNVEPGKAKRWTVDVKPMGRTSTKYRLEIHPSRGEIFAGLVRPGTALEAQNAIWHGTGSGVISQVQGRVHHISTTVAPGKYDVVVENRSQYPCTTKVILKILYEK